jgi:SAM-dependent methyltransferase
VRDDDPYSRFSYRRLIAWPERILRERPFLESELERSPRRSVLDLGCGTGEHSLLFASLGFVTTGIDRSEEMIDKAREYEGQHPPYGPRFVRGDFAELPAQVGESYGAAICLGNVLPHLDDGALESCLEAWAAWLVPEGRLVLQLLNYERIRSESVRHLPLNFREDPEGDGEIVFLRLMTPAGDHHVLFHPTTLHLRPRHDPPLELKATREVRLRAWTRPELEGRLTAAGFSCEAIYGDMTRGSYRAESSPDLVVVAVRSS